MADDFKGLRNLALQLAEQEAPASHDRQPDMWKDAENGERLAKIKESLLIDLATSKDVRKQKLFIEIAWGLPANKIEVTGADGQPLLRKPGEMTDEELIAEIRSNRRN